MPKTHMRVQLLDVTQNALALIYAACRQCYARDFAGDIYETARTSDPAQQEDFVRKIAASGHESPLEHVKFTFAIEGVSRALTHQLVRHRLASYSQQSQRYVKETDFDFVIPPSIENNDKAKEEFLNLMQHIQRSYTRLVELYKEQNVAGEAAQQDARFVLPQACETKIVITMNCRELLHYFKHRLCTRAQWEIRALAAQMLLICKKELPAVFARAGAKCEELKFCPEDKKFSCGRYPVRDAF